MCCVCCLAFMVVHFLAWFVLFYQETILSRDCLHRGSRGCGCVCSSLWQWFCRDPRSSRGPASSVWTSWLRIPRTWVACVYTHPCYAGLGSPLCRGETSAPHHRQTLLWAVRKLFWSLFKDQQPFLDSWLSARLSDPVPWPGLLPPVAIKITAPITVSEFDNPSHSCHDKDSGFDLVSSVFQVTGNFPIILSCSVLYLDDSSHMFHPSFPYVYVGKDVHISPVYLLVRTISLNELFKMQIWVLTHSPSTLRVSARDQYRTRQWGYRAKWTLMWPLEAQG